MPSSTRRSPKAAPPRRSPRAAPPPPAATLTARPVQAPFAAVFGLLVAVEALYLAWLLWEPDPGIHWFVAVPLLLAVAAAAGSVLVFLGRARGWALLAVVGALQMLVMLALVLLFGALGGGEALWWALLLLVAPVGCLVLALQRPVREWTRPRRASRPAEGARRRTSAR
jgi:hypothetical protein